MASCRERRRATVEWVVGALLGAAALATVATAAAPAAAAGLPTATCLACHNRPAAGPGKSGRVSLNVNAAMFQASVHAALGCAGCHSDVSGFPHQPPPKAVSCAGCHPQQNAAYAHSVHAKVAPVHPSYPGCLECHGNPHAIRARTDPRSPVYPLNLPRTCGACHGSPELAKRYGLTATYALYMDSVHGFALTEDGLLVAAQCASCHGAHRILGPEDPQSRVNRVNIPATCGNCHSGMKARYFAGIHGKAMAAGNSHAPVCTDCHTAHQIARISATAWQVKTVATCGGCHGGQLRSYRDTFHGQVTRLGFATTARCWSCHSAHLVLPASDPRSTVAPANLVATCGKCHAGAGTSFTTYRPHADPYNERLNPTLYYATRFMNLLLLSVLVFFGLHTALWLARSALHRLGSGPSGGDADGGGR